MKTERGPVARQYGGGSLQRQDRRHATSATAAPSTDIAPTVSVVIDIDMGLQPLTHATSRLSHLASCPMALDQTCQCAHKPVHRTILHGILTGQGYKFGYGPYATAHLLQDNSGYHEHDDAPLCLSLERIEDQSLDRSHGMTLPSKCTTQPAGK